MRHSVAALISFLMTAYLPVQTTVILRGRVVMSDGSSPNKSVGIVRICTDNNGTAPGPLTEKDGSFIWTMEADYMATRRCFLEATLSGYQSTQVEISNVNPALGANVDLKPIALTLKGGDPYLLGVDGSEIPSKGRAEWNAALKAATVNDRDTAAAQLKAATAINPKFALAWHNLGILHDLNHDFAEARAAYLKAIEADPKMLRPYVALARLMVMEKDWPGVIKTAATFIPLDKNRIFAEMHLHQAVAQFNLKDLAAAQASALEALNPKARQPVVRAEYVLGRILEAKGDAVGAKQHMSRYLMRMERRAESRDCE
jgi:tetratricopeptide (TPR) repeat protein